MASAFVRGARHGRRRGHRDRRPARPDRRRSSRRPATPRPPRPVRHPATVIALPRPCLCLVTDRALVSSDARTLAGRAASRSRRWLDEAIDAGVDVIQIRERDLDAGRARCALVSARRRARARGRRRRVLVNDRADVALAAGADGVHLRADGPPIARVRALAPRPWIDRAIGSHGRRGRRRIAAPTTCCSARCSRAARSRPARRVAGLDGAARGASPAARPPVLAIGGIDARARARVRRGRARPAWRPSALFLPRRPDAGRARPGARPSRRFGRRMDAATRAKGRVPLPMTESRHPS